MSVLTVIAAYIQWFISWVNFFCYFLLSDLKNRVFQSLDDRHKWVTREVTRLEALVKDYNGTVGSVEYIQQRATHFWDSELGVAGISLQLEEDQIRWLKGAEYLSREARLLINDYENLMLKRGFSSKVVARWKLVVEVRQAMKRINNHSKNKEAVKLIVESLEVSKSKLGRLLDGPIDERNHKSISSKTSFRSGAALVSVFRGLTDQNPSLKRGLEEQVACTDMQLMLLYAFMKDLRGLRLESAVENTWVEEAQEIISTTERAIDTLFLYISRFSLFGDWSARRGFKREMERLSGKVLDLFKAKSNYGFQFISRVSSSFTDQHPLPPESNIILIPTERNVQVEELSRNLERANLLLRETRANEGARLTRMECQKQLQKLASKATNSSEAFVQNLRSWLFLLSLGRSKFLEETRVISEQVDLLEKSIEAYSIKIVRDSSYIVGLDEDIHSIVTKMMTRPTPRLSLFCITGIHGIGKTALARKVFNHTSVLNNHHLRHWFTLPKDSDDFLLFLKKEQNGLQNQENCYLLVFDNLESKESWGVVKTSLEADEIRAVIKIVITTCKTTVALHVNPTIIHPIRLRTKDESWEYFTQMVPMNSEIAIPASERTVPEEVEALARRLVAKTGGLPLAIVYLGYRFTVNKLTEKSLKKVLERVKLGQNQSMWFDTQDLNKDNWESQRILSQCLSYFESFPVDFIMPARRLVAVLVAQGLVDSESTAYNRLTELVNRNMIQIVEKRLNGKIKTCHFPSNLREPWQRRRHEATHIRSWYLISTGLERQRTYHFSDINANSSQRIPSLRSNSSSFLYEESLPSSMMFFDSREGGQPGEDIGEFLKKGIKGGDLKDLLVLDLEGVYRPNLPESIGDLKQLTYLGLRWTDLETIPTSINKLLNLQTLDVKYTSIQTLPMSVWKLKKLRRLYLNDRCRVEYMPRPGAVFMDDLEILSGAFLDGDSPLSEGLAQLVNLRKLGLTFRLSDQQQQVLGTSIMKLIHLQSLSLSLMSSYNGQELALTTLEPLTELSTLYLFGKLRHEPSCITASLPISLTELILSASQLPETAMHSLTRLENLKSLSFFSGSYQGNEMVFPRRTFPRLLYLKFWSLGHLEKIIIEEGAMKSLWEMEMRSCGNLVEVNGLARLETLQELKLTNMPTDFAGKVENYFKKATQEARFRIVHTPRIRTHNCGHSETCSHS